MSAYVLDVALAVAAAGTTTAVELTTTPFFSGGQAVGVIACDDLVGSTALDIEGSPDGTTGWTSIMTSAKIGDTTEMQAVTLQKFVRANVTGYTSGTVDFKLIAGI